MLVVWVLYLVIKVVLTDGGELGGPPPPDTVGAHGFWALVGIVIGFSRMWGNEPTSSATGSRGSGGRSARTASG